MKCIVKACPFEGIRPVTISLPKGMELGRHEVLAQDFRADVKMCLRHHRLYVGHGINQYSLRVEEA